MPALWKLGNYAGVAGKVIVGGANLPVATGGGSADQKVDRRHGDTCGPPFAVLLLVSEIYQAVAVINFDI